MKTTVKNLAKVTVKAALLNAAMLSLAIGLATTATAQSNRFPGNDINGVSNASQNIAFAAELTQSSTDGSVASAPVQGAAISSNPTDLLTELPKAVDQAMAMISMEKLMNGESKATVVVGGSNSVLDEQSINVKVNYEARPIGGILIVRASMIPTFRGVGVSARPTISRSVAMAVDDLDAQQIKDVVADLTKEINEEYARN